MSEQPPRNPKHTDEGAGGQQPRQTTIIILVILAVIAIVALLFVLMRGMQDPGEIQDTEEGDTPPMDQSERSSEDQSSSAVPLYPADEEAVTHFLSTMEIP